MPMILTIRSSVSAIVAVLLMLTPLFILAAPSPNVSEDYGDWIVMLADDAKVLPAQAAEQAVMRAGGKVSAVYELSFKGYAVRGASKRALERQQGVALVEPDLVVTTFEQQTVPTGVRRIEAHLNTTAKIDGKDGIDERVNVAVAVIDTGVQSNHPDLNVAKNINCISVSSCDDVGLDTNIDDDGHGTHVAGTIGALDNTIGVVGVAPGAQIWALKVLDSNGSGAISDIIKAVELVTLNAENIDVANMSLGAVGYSSALHIAIQASVEAGVVYVVAAGNSSRDVLGSDGKISYGESCTFRGGRPSSQCDTIPAAYPEVATISAMVDTDGKPGGEGNSTSWGTDDSFASFSNYGASVLGNNPVTSLGGSIDLMLPGVLIHSTWINGGYHTISGTSMAAPHAAGLAALEIARTGKKPKDATDVYAVRQTLINNAKAQNSDFGLSTQNDPDNYKEPIGYAGSNTVDNVDNEPIAVISGPTEAVVGVSVTFDASGSTDDKGIASYLWDFGDNSSGISSVVTHTYTAIGTYQVTLTVTDTVGQTNTAITSIKVIEAPEPADIPLSVTTRKVRGFGYADLDWSEATGDSFDVFRNGTKINGSLLGTKTYTDNLGRGGGTYTYYVCEANSTTVCSNEVTVSL